MGNDKSLNQYVSLYDYLSSCNNVDKRKVIYFISKHLNGLHNSGLYVPYFYLKTIEVNSSNLSDIKFPSIANGQHDLEFEKYKNGNIYELAMISFASHLPGYNLKEQGLLNYSVIKENFDSFTYIFNNQDVNYYRDIFVNDNYSYYSNYIDDLQKKTGNNASNSNNRAYSYSTKEGRLMSEKEAAFTSYLLLFANIGVVGLLFMLMLLYL